MMQQAETGMEATFRLGAGGRVLYLTKDAALIQRQLAGEEIAAPDLDELLAGISTDALFPGPGMRESEIARFTHWCCANLPNKAIAPGDLQAAFERGLRFEVVVAGAGFGRGSSRENAPLAQKLLGTRLLVAPSFEKIYADNCRNLGLIASRRLDLVARLRDGEAVPLEWLLEDADPVARRVLAYGGLFDYTRAREAGQAPPLRPSAPPRPQTMVERIVARLAAPSEAAAPSYVRPGDAVDMRIEGTRFSHDGFSFVVDELFHREFGADARVSEPESCLCFFDHRPFFMHLPAVQSNAGRQASFAERHGIRLYDAFSGICHEVVSKDYARPGMAIVGTDSHTCTSGVMGAFAFGVGFTEYANALRTRDIALVVPPTVRYEFVGQRPAGLMAKDVILHLLAQPFIADGSSIGVVFEFGGPGLADWPLDELAVLTNMAVEGRAMTGIVEPQPAIRAHLAEHYGLAEDEIERLMAAARPDPSAEYAARFEIDLAALEPMVALPGDPCNGVPLSTVGTVALDKGFIGSCTGGKLEDLRAAADVLRGQRVADGVQLYVEAASRSVYEQAQREGLADVFLAAGAQAFLEAACGACGGSGPGMAEREDEVIISSTNRNFVGRMGQGNRQTYLANPAVVAASAVLGRIGAPGEIG
jgi:3-isopropylmalate/(R)-2-methylmalate dehydratase large subunit